MDRPLLQTGPLTEDLGADVCIIGAGITGLLTANRLVDEGLSVVVIDSGPISGGETSRTTAHAVTALDDRYTRLERLHGHAGARLAAESHARAIDHVERLVAESGIDCCFLRLDGYLTVGERHGARARELLEAERAACRRAGLDDVEIVSTLPRGWPEGAGPALCFPRQAQFDPLLLMEGLVERLRARSARIFTGTHARRVHGGDDAHVITRGGPVVRARHIVVATNTPINDLVIVHTKQAGYQTYVIALDVPVSAISPALMWDGYWEDDDAYHYVRLRHAAVGGRGGTPVRSGTDQLIVGGEDHKTGQDHHDLGRHARLEKWTRDRFPMAGEVVARWSGEVMEPVDGLAYIGHNPLDHRNVYVATGDSGNGMTHGAIAALILADCIQGRKNPWAHLYEPSRKPGLRALGRFASENVNTLRQYGDWLSAGPVASEAEIEPGTGAVLTHGLKRIAVYRDECGHCTRLNAVCTHLGGLVRWNGQEQTWDCPCHGSRFDKWGHVIHGPASSDLRPHAGDGERCVPEKDTTTPAEQR